MYINSLLSLTFLGKLVGESFSCGGKLAQFTADHFIGDLYLNVLFAVVDLKLQANELRNDRTTSGVGSDGVSCLDGVPYRQRDDVGALPN